MPAIQASDAETLSGTQKAAVLLVSLGAEVSAQVFKLLNEEEIETLTTEISRMQNVAAETTGPILQEFHQMALAQEYIAQGGIPYAAEVLERALGAKRAKEILERLRGQIQPAAFEIVKKVEPKNLLDFIRREHPQTIALILANMDPKQAAQILSELAPALQSDVVLRIATMDKTNPEVIKQIESILESRLSSLFTQEVSLSGGVKAVAEIMNRLDRSTERSLLGTMQESEAELAENIRRLMFTFEDLVMVDDRGVQRILKEIDQRDLALALKATSSEVSAKIFQNMSERASTLLKEEIGYLGPVRLRDVEESQRRIVDLVRRLEESGEIMVQGRGGQDDVVV
ncbi:MAG TPA: flagellar motor switch protein FliG [Candidatus Methylomirabilis sp.]|nr:flagellar motor switch protein FliG [Candidatus Methylomirabilis sp.]